MNSTLLNQVLPPELVEFFEIIELHELGDLQTKKVFIEVELEEKNTLPSGYDSAAYASKGFLSCKRVQNFPLRGKAVYLNIKRRRWRHKETKVEIRSDFSFLAEGSKLTQELADFLKTLVRLLIWDSAFMGKYFNHSATTKCNDFSTARTPFGRPTTEGRPYDSR